LCSIPLYVEIKVGDEKELKIKVKQKGVQSNGDNIDAVIISVVSRDVTGCHVIKSRSVCTCFPYLTPPYLLNAMVTEDPEGDLRQDVGVHAQEPGDGRHARQRLHPHQPLHAGPQGALHMSIQIRYDAAAFVSTRAVELKVSFFFHAGVVRWTASSTWAPCRPSAPRYVAYPHFIRLIKQTHGDLMSEGHRPSPPSRPVPLAPILKLSVCVPSPHFRPIGEQQQVAPSVRLGVEVNGPLRSEFAFVKNVMARYGSTVDRGIDAAARTVSPPTKDFSVLLDLRSLRGRFYCFAFPKIASFEFEKTPTSRVFCT
jgi:hypothetical protein